MPGWKAYFQLAQTPNVFRELDKWIRHRLRAVQLKHWCRGTTMYRELKAMGASDEDARKVAANSRCWWRNSRMRLNRAMPIAYFDRPGVPRLSSHKLNDSNRPVRTRTPGGVGGERSDILAAPIPIAARPEDSRAHLEPLRLDGEDEVARLPVQCLPYRSW